MSKILLNQTTLKIAEQYQEEALQLVSRTFAFTIPQLPVPLRRAMANAYLLCRAVDTIEDDPDLSIERKEYFGKELVKVVCQQRRAEDFSTEILPQLSPQSSEAERDLLQKLPLLIAIKRSLNLAQQQAIERCVKIMWYGMSKFLQKRGVDGLANQQEMDTYCYYVAGVVGELLTDLFCDYSPEIASRRDALYELSSSFGKGLQMVNILKDQWEDRDHGVCWLPRDLFAQHGIDLSGLSGYCPAFDAAQVSLLGIAHAHLRNGLAYTLLIPSGESGIRRFCYWTIGLAVMTLSNISRKPNFTNGAAIKVSRKRVSTMIVLTNIASDDDDLLTSLFNRSASRLPLPEFVSDWRITGDDLSALDRK